jgi:hypothetical protein
VKQHELAWIALGRWVDDDPQLRTLTTGFIHGNNFAYIEARWCAKPTSKPEFRYGEGSTLFDAAADLAGRMALEVTQ